MRVVVVNASPHMDKGTTAGVLNPFVEGMKEAGAEVEILYTKKLKIKPCEGCFTCWVKTPGVCVHKDDDMPDVLKKMGAEIWVLATPVYVDGMTGPMKTFLARMIPGAQPFFEMRDGHNRHPGRGIRQGGKVVLVSSCGFWELDNFDPLVVHVKAYCKNANREFAGALRRPRAGALGPMVQAGIAADVVAAAKEAGRQVVADGKIREETLGVVRRELLPMNTYFEMANRSFKQRIDDNVKQ